MSCTKKANIVRSRGSHSASRLLFLEFLFPNSMFVPQISHAPGLFERSVPPPRHALPASTVLYLAHGSLESYV